MDSKSSSALPPPEAFDISDEEDARITAAALADPDAQPWDGTGKVTHARDMPPEKLAWLKAQTRMVPGRGPQKAPRKVATSIRLDPDIVARFKADGPGWQSRINATLRAAVDAGTIAKPRPS